LVKVSYFPVLGKWSFWSRLP